MAEARGTAGTSRKGRSRGAERLPPRPAVRPDRLAFTLDLNTGQITCVEGVDADGVRRELSEREMTDLRSGLRRARIETLLEEAFEAGITCVLGDGDAEEPPETSDDTDLRQIILKPLMEGSAAARLMRSDVLDQAIVETLIDHALSRRPAGPNGGPQEPDSKRAASPNSAASH
ncbi:hypothetical protein ACRAWG_26185 [Methylobacterium sp. P31]